MTNRAAESSDVEPGLVALMGAPQAFLFAVALARGASPNATLPFTAANPDALSSWVQLYWQTHVLGAPTKTLAAKRQDLQRFVLFFATEVGHDHLDSWTPAVTRHFLTALLNTVSSRTQNVLAASSANRVAATLRTFARWVHAQRPFLAGSPFAGVKDVGVEEPSWQGLTSRQILRLKAACEQRAAMCERRNQNPQLESAVFYSLLHTGLREFELVSLDLADYHHRGFHDVRRKGSRVSKKVPLPTEAREVLDRYIKERRGRDPGPLFVSAKKTRLTVRGVAYICERLARQACVNVADVDERFHLTPHQLRHTFLKRIADKHGVHHAQRMSGNVSIREVFRYTKPSADEMEQTAEGLF